MIKVDNINKVKKPNWLKIKLKTSSDYLDMKTLLEENKLK